MLNRRGSTGSSNTLKSWAMNRLNATNTSLEGEVTNSSSVHDIYYLILLDGRRFPFDCKKDLTVQQLFDYACSELSVQESKYFSLFTYDARGNRHWLEMRMKVNYSAADSSKHAPSFQIYFGVKFFAPDINHMLHFTSIELLYFQCRQLVYRGEIVAPWDVLFQLTAIAFQESFGDFESPASTNDRIAQQKFLNLPPGSPHLMVECQQRVSRYYQSLLGKKRGEAILNYMQLVQQLPTYGKHFYPVKVKTGKEVWLSIGLMGLEEWIDVKRDVVVNGQQLIEDSDTLKPISRHHWDNISNIKNTNKDLTIEIEPIGGALPHVASNHSLTDVRNRRNTEHDLSLPYEGAAKTAIRAVTDSPLLSRISNRSKNSDFVGGSTRRVGACSVTWTGKSEIMKNVFRLASEHHKFYLSYTFGDSPTSDQKQDAASLYFPNHLPLPHSLSNSGYKPPQSQSYPNYQNLNYSNNFRNSGPFVYPSAAMVAAASESPLQNNATALTSSSTEQNGNPNKTPLSAIGINEHGASDRMILSTSQMSINSHSSGFSDGGFAAAVPHNSNTSNNDVPITRNNINNNSRRPYKNCSVENIQYRNSTGSGEVGVVGGGGYRGVPLNGAGGEVSSISFTDRNSHGGSCMDNSSCSTESFRSFSMLSGTSDLGPSLETLQDLVVAFSNQRDCLLDKLRVKIEQLKEVCLQESEITGVLPIEYPVSPQSSPPPPRKRIGTAFELSDKVLENVSRKQHHQQQIQNGAHVPKSTHLEELEAAKLQLQTDIDVKSQIIKAEKRLLAENKSLKKAKRKERKQTIQRMEVQLSTMQMDLSNLRRKIDKCIANGGSCSNSNSPNLNFTRRNSNRARTQSVTDKQRNLIGSADLLNVTPVGGAGGSPSKHSPYKNNDSEYQDYQNQSSNGTIKSSPNSPVLGRKNNGEWEKNEDDYLYGTKTVLRHNGASRKMAADAFFMLNDNEEHDFSALSQLNERRGDHSFKSEYEASPASSTNNIRFDPYSIRYVNRISNENSKHSAILNEVSTYEEEEGYVPTETYQVTNYRTRRYPTYSSMKQKHKSQEDLLGSNGASVNAGGTSTSSNYNWRQPYIGKKSMPGVVSTTVTQKTSTVSLNLPHREVGTTGNGNINMVQSNAMVYSTSNSSIRSSNLDVGENRCDLDEVLGLGLAASNSSFNSNISNNYEHMASSHSSLSSYCNQKTTQPRQYALPYKSTQKCSTGVVGGGTAASLTGSESESQSPSKYYSNNSIQQIQFQSNITSRSMMMPSCKSPLFQSITPPSKPRSNRNFNFHYPSDQPHKTTGATDGNTPSYYSSTDVLSQSQSMHAIQTPQSPPSYYKVVEKITITEGKGSCRDERTTISSQLSPAVQLRHLNDLKLTPKDETLSNNCGEIDSTSPNFVAEIPSNSYHTEDHSSSPTGMSWV